MNNSGLPFQTSTFWMPPDNVTALAVQTKLGPINSLNHLVNLVQDRLEARMQVEDDPDYAAEYLVRELESAGLAGPDVLDPEDLAKGKARAWNDLFAQEDLNLRLEQMLPEGVTFPAQPKDDPEIKELLLELSIADWVNEVTMQR